MEGPILRKYGVAATINFPLLQTDGVDFRIDAVHAAGDTKIMKDEGAEANTANAFVDEGTGYSIAVSAAELTAARVVIYIVDQTGPKAWLDTAIVIETYGHASAQHAFDLDTAIPGVDVVQVSGDSVAADNLELMFDGTGYAGGTAKLGVDVVAISGDAPAADNLELMFDGTGYAGGTTKLGVDLIQINSSATAAVLLALAADTIESGTVDTTGFAPTTTEFEADDITTAAADHWIGRLIIFTSGTLLKQGCRIDDYVLTGGRAHFTVTALTSAPLNNVTFVIQ